MEPVGNQALALAKNLQLEIPSVLELFPEGTGDESVGNRGRNQLERVYDWVDEEVASEWISGSTVLGLKWNG